MREPQRPVDSQLAAEVDTGEAAGARLWLGLGAKREAMMTGGMYGGQIWMDHDHHYKLFNEKYLNHFSRLEINFLKNTLLTSNNKINPKLPT